MTRPLPAWADALTPVGMDGAAILLGVSRRFLVDVLRDNPHYEKRGNRKVFYPEHIALLREALKCPTSKSKSEKASGTPLEPLVENGFERVLALAIASKRKSTKRGGRLSGPRKQERE